MADSVSKSSIFESVSLGSTICNSKRENDISVINSRIPESVSATSDDDELDPEEFLSHGLPQIPRKKSSTSINNLEDLDGVGILNSTTILGDKDTNKTYIGHIHKSNNEYPVLENEFQKESGSLSSVADSSLLNSLHFLTQNPFSMSKSNSVYFLKPHAKGKDSPVEFLQETNQSLQRDLHKNIKIQKKLLVNGDNTSKVRSVISQNFKQLSENFYSLNEVYSQEVGYNESLNENFKKWDNRREKILNRISSIKSNKTKHGSKLEKLLDESNGIDNDICDLEAKLNSLKIKKKLINAEIEDTSSVLESRTSKYVETFKNLEKQGAGAIIEFLSSNNIPSSEMENVVKYVPIDVTFSNHYKQIMQSNINKNQARESTPTTTNKISNETKTPELIGMQPLIVPEILNQQDKSLADHRYGLTPFEEGFEKGSKVSHTVRNHLNSFIKSLVSNEEDVNIPTDVSFTAGQLDDISNTVNQKINLVPILKFLDNIEENSREMLRYTSDQATLYHEYGILWNEVVNIIRNQENKLLLQLSGNALSKGELDEKIIFILGSGLDQLKSYISAQISCLSTFKPDSLTIQNSTLFKCVIHEVKAICSALAVASDDNGYLEKVVEFRALFRSTNPDTNNIINNQQPGNSKNRLQDMRSASLRPSKLYRPTKTVPSTGTISVNHLSSGSSDLVPENSTKKIDGMGTDMKQGIFDQNFKKKE